jgi:hypothetical protein
VVDPSILRRIHEEKIYKKPTLRRRSNLSKVTAAIASDFTNGGEPVPSEP